ncbi:hypothetical protein [Cellulomonas biazotea]|uniref:Secreted protein n=1 Tax=Cellulomonas biazotea TaxID=1709 RepID=A0A402DRR3_9CELL|nr:hypothetical protein [Cellulomonas biazotea]GCE76850.1 hypothetical protein CBZ_19060 [Cellulomonas biazotea]
MLRKAMLTIPVLLLAAAGGLAAPTASAAPPPVPPADVRVMPMAHVGDDGASLTVRVLLVCQPDGTDGIQWEGFVNASQGDTFAWAGLPLRCDGRRHVVTVDLPVSAPEGTASFTRGTADVTVVLMDENTLTTYADDQRTVRVRSGLSGMPCR